MLKLDGEYSVWICHIILNDEHFSHSAKVIHEQDDMCKSFEASQTLGVMTLKLAFEPHLFDMHKAPIEQMELTDLSKDNILKSLFDAMKDPIQI